MEIITSNILLAITTNWCNITILLTMFTVIITTRPLMLIVLCSQLIVLSELQAVTIPGLQNLLALIHPILVLGVYSYLFYWILGAAAGSYKIGLSLFVVWFALALGGWWAYQEFTWGGWWNWDGVETPVLILSLAVLFGYFHSRYLGTYLTVVKFKMIVLALLLLVLLIVRFGGLDSVHAFVQQNSVYNQYSTLGLLVISPIMLILWLLVKKIIVITSYIFLKSVLLLSVAIYTGNILRLKVLKTIHIAVLVTVWFVVIVNFAYVEFVEGGGVLHVHNYQYVLWSKPRTLYIFDNNSHLNYLIN